MPYLSRNIHPVSHCGRNTHFWQIYFAVPNFNFIYIYIKLKKLCDAAHIFWRNTQKLQSEKTAQVKRTNAPSLVVILQVKTFIAIVYTIQVARKKYVNKIKRALDFYYYSPFLYGNTFSQHMVQMEDLMDIYLFGVSINRMLISQLKRFSNVKFMFPHRFNV